MESVPYLGVYTHIVYPFLSFSESSTDSFVFHRADDPEAGGRRESGRRAGPPSPIGVTGRHPVSVRGMDWEYHARAPVDSLE